MFTRTKEGEVFAGELVEPDIRMRTNANEVLNANANECTVKTHFTVTSFVRSPHHYGHICLVPNYIPPCKFAPCNTDTSPLRSLLPRPMGDHNSEVSLYPKFE